MRMDAGRADREGHRTSENHAATVYASRVPNLHVAIATHSPKPLDWTLLGIAKQTLRPATVVVSADNDREDILETVLDASAQCKRDLVLVQRASRGEDGIAQTRNNAVRALIMLGVASSDRIITLDADCVPSPLLCEVHERVGRRGEVVVGSRIDLSDEQSASFSVANLRAGISPVDVLPEQESLLRRRQRRYTWYARLRPLGLVKPHKPKLVESNFSVRVDDFVRVNGFDEEQSPGSREGDDMGRRLYAAGIPPGIAVMLARTYHLYHPSRDPAPRPAAPLSGSGLAPVRLRLTWRCVRGLDRPIEQEKPIVRICRAGRVVDERVLAMPTLQPPTGTGTR